MPNCACGARVDYGTDGHGYVVARPCERCARAARLAALRARIAERVRADAARRQPLLATLGALLGAHYRATATPEQHLRGRWRRRARRAAAKRKALGLPRAETPAQRRQRRAGVAKLRADPAYVEIDRMRRREKAAADRARGIKRKRSEQIVACTVCARAFRQRVVTQVYCSRLCASTGRPRRTLSALEVA